MAHHDAQPIGGPLNKKFMTVMGVILGIWGVVLLYRFIFGIGVVSGLTDYYPWGVWIAFDVVTGTALACGGYAVAILAYILNKGQYHPLVRPAILTSALGYSMAGLAIVLDVGRWWGIWKIPIGGWPDMGRYNWDSALLEVALCVMAYVGVLWIELGPAFLEKWKATSKSSGLQSFAKVGLAFYDKALIWIIALGLLLPTMHQSSLGTLMLLAGDKLHGLWYTPWIPLLYLISCVGMGYAVVVWESSLSHRLFKRQSEKSMLVSMSGAMVVVVALYLVLRFADIAISGKIGLLFTSGWLSLVFWLEIVMFGYALFLLSSKQRRSHFPNMLTASILLMLAGAFYRFNTYITAYNPAPGKTYFPSLLEIYITVGVVALEVTLYYIIVKRYPILGGVAPEGSAA